MGERQFGPYRLVQQIAVGGMAEIHLAKTHGIAGFEKYVALKMIHPNFSQDEQFIQMLIDEAKITVQLQHVNIAQTFDLGRVGDSYYITMEFVDGADLYKLLRRGSERDLQTPVDVAAFIAKEMATGLDYAHRKRDVAGRPLRIVHRDVSPQNVLISNAGEVKLVDFGIAKATMRVRQTAVGVIKGKYYYMSPEQAWGDPLDHRSDVFSCGIVLYEMLTGQMLYLEEDLHRLLDMVRKANIAPPTMLRKDIPPQLERIVMNALAKRPGDRYQTAGDLASDLERFLHVYSPVFTASKVMSYSSSVLSEDDPAPLPVAVPTPAPVNPQRVTKQVSRDQLVRARSEFTDENSVIFRVQDLARGREPGGFNEDTGVTAPEPLKRKLAAPPQSDSPDTRHRPDLGEEGDDKTVVSGPPGFGTGSIDARAEVAALVGGGGDPDTTIIQRDSGSDFEERPTRAQTPPQLRVPMHTDDEGPTRTDLARAPSPPSGSRKRPAAPAHPALAASTPRPAVSELRKPRRSRRTPPAGVPTVGGGQSESILAAIVGSAVSDSAPTAPAPRPGPPPTPSQDGIPKVVFATNSPPPAQALPPGHHQPPIPGPPPPRPPPGPPPPQPGPEFPLAAPMQTPNPFEPLSPPPGSQPLVPLPTGPALPSITKQLAAIEINEIPDAFKVGRKAPSPWIIRSILATALVFGGVFIGVKWFGGNEPTPIQGKISIVSEPRGATVSVNGRKLPDLTPVDFLDTEEGAVYKIVYELPGYRTRTREVTYRGSPIIMPAILEKIWFRLVVVSKPDADVYVDGVRFGPTPLDKKFHEPPRTVEVRHRTLGTQKRTLSWGDKLELSESFMLRK